MRALLLVVACLLGLVRPLAADPLDLLRGLDSDDSSSLSAGVAAIEQAPTTPDLADVLFAAGRACEDRLHDPARALAIYERILRELPDASVAIAAGRRAEQLRAARGHAREAAELAQLIANADALPASEVERRGDALATAPWPGALDAALWLADWQCRTRRFDEAQARYAALVARAADAPQTAVARRNAAGCAIEAGDWELADRLAHALPHGDPIDDAVRADLLDAADTGRRRAALYTWAWLAFAVALAGLLASLGEAMLRGGMRRPPWQPPIEVLYMGPIAAVVMVATFVVDRSIAPAVMRISLGGVALAWVSGTALDLLRARERHVRLRAVLHVVLCAVGVLAIGYIAISRDGLIDMFSETVRFGPGA